MIVAEGHRQIGEVGFARFSAREVAKRVGYSIGTIYNVFGSYDQLILAINGRTLDLWLAALESRGLAGIQPQYEARSVTLGRTVQVIGTGETFVGKAEHIDGEGALHVRDAAGNLRRVLSGDVSVRGVMGYV